MALESMAYHEAVAELETLLKRIENDTTSLDDLARDVERAAVLISFCRGRIRETETRVQEIVDGLNGDT